MVLAAIIGAAGGGPGYRAISDPRQYPYTSVDAEAMEKRVRSYVMEVAENINSEDKRIDNSIRELAKKHEARMDRADKRHAQLNDIVANLPPDKLLERLTRNEEKLKYLERSCVKWAGPVLPK